MKFYSSSEKIDFKNIFSAKYIDWYKFKHKNIFITGGTGLIGRMLVKSLCYANEKLGLNIRIVLLVRNIFEAKQYFEKYFIEKSPIEYLEGNVNSIPNIDKKIDYIVHAACPTASEYFINSPVETIKTSVLGTMNILELAKQNCIKGMVYLSSMEVYGTNTNEKLLTENDLGYINLQNIRSSYPESKRMCEMLCTSYAKEYDVPVCSIRLAQTFGPGVSCNDVRVFAMIARSIINSEDIVFQTKGESKHSYLYISDAITAILCVLLNGNYGNTYNAANPSTYCSIADMGYMVAKELGKGKVKIRFEDNKKLNKYPTPSFLNLDISAIKKLGWIPTVDLLTMYQRMIESMKLDGV